MSSRKILYICYEDITGCNGAIRHITEIVKGLARAGHELHLCVPGMNSRTAAVELEQVRLHVIPTLPCRLLRPASWLLLSLLYLPLLCLRLRPDAIYVRDIRFTILPVGLARLLAIPVVLEVNGLMDEAARFHGLTPALTRLLEAMHGWNLRRADRIVTVTASIRDVLISRYGAAPDKVAIITNGVDLTRFAPRPQTEARARTGLAQRFRYVGFVGGLFPWHGLDLLVAAAPLIIAKEPATRFVIVGTGPMEKSLRQQVAQQGLEPAFIFTGRVAPEAVPDYINACELCVVFFKPVRQDPGDPIKLYEYLACGRPVVASAGPGYGELVAALGTGASVDAADPRALAAAILGLLQDPEQAAAMGARGRDHARRHFSWDEKAAATGQMISELTRAGGLPANA